MRAAVSYAKHDWERGVLCCLLAMALLPAVAVAADGPPPMIVSLVVYEPGPEAIADDFGPGSSWEFRKNYQRNTPVGRYNTVPQGVAGPAGRRCGKAEGYVDDHGFVYLHGAIEITRESGLPLFSGHYEHGFLSGRQTLYDDKGRILEEQWYVREERREFMAEDEPTATVLTRRRFYEQGEPANGALSVSRLDKERGYEGSRLPRTMAGELKNGYFHGLCRQYGPGGRLVCLAQYDQGEVKRRIALWADGGELLSWDRREEDFCAWRVNERGWQELWLYLGVLTRQQEAVKELPVEVYHGTDGIVFGIKAFWPRGYGSLGLYLRHGRRISGIDLFPGHVWWWPNGCPNSLSYADNAGQFINMDCYSDGTVALASKWRNGEIWEGTRIHVGDLEEWREGKLLSRKPFEDTRGLRRNLEGNFPPLSKEEQIRLWPTKEVPPIWHVAEQTPEGKPKVARAYKGDALIAQVDFQGNGQVAAVSGFDDGKPVGPTVCFHPNGVPSRAVVREDHTPVREYRWWPNRRRQSLTLFAAGLPAKTTFWAPDGPAVAEGALRDGQPWRGQHLREVQGQWRLVTYRDGAVVDEKPFTAEMAAFAALAAEPFSIEALYPPPPAKQ